MDRVSRGAALALLFVVLAAACGSEDTGGALDTGAGTVPLRPGATTLPPGATVLTADLSGTEEVPGPGAGGGRGTARLVLTGDGRVCADLTSSRIDLVTAAHVHSGAKGTAGPVAVALPTPKDGRASDCVTADPATVARVVADPGAAYVNIHTTNLPDGAIRGQLAKA